MIWPNRSSSSVRISRARTKCEMVTRTRAPIAPSATIKIGIATRRRTCADMSLMKGMSAPLSATPCPSVNSTSGIQVSRTRMPALRSKAAFDSGCASLKRRSVVAAAPPSVIEKLGPSAAVTMSDISVEG
jgi:hypothetical protein